VTMGSVTADSAVVADDLLEEDPPRHWAVKHLGERELGLQDGQVVAVTRGPVGRTERVREACEPLAQQGVDLGGAEGVADGVDRQPVGPDAG
jgi:hypothetical protein